MSSREEPKPPRERSRSRSSLRGTHTPRRPTTAPPPSVAQTSASKGSCDPRAPRSVVPRDILVQAAAEHGPDSPAPHLTTPTQLPATDATPSRQSRPATKKTTQLQRSPSAPARAEAPPLSPQTALNQDLMVIAELQRKGCLSKQLLEHISIFLNDRVREFEPRDQPMTQEGITAPARRQRTPENEQDAHRKRPCVDTSRDPRLRSRDTPGPSHAPPPPLTVHKPPATPTYADAIRTQTPAVQTTAATTIVPPAPAPARAREPSVPRYPPLVVESLPNWATHFKTIKSRLGHAPNARPFGKGVRFSPKSEDEYRAIQKYLYEIEKTENISWFSYSLPADRSLKVAIRGLPVSTEPQEIEDALRELGYIPEYIRPIRARKGRPGCIYLAILKNTPDLTPGIYNITELLYMPGIKIEAWRAKKGPAQCHRCQAFRHSSHNCHRQQACVRCGGEHAARDCTRPLEEPATCINCGGPHPANNIKCPQYKRELRNMKAGTVAATQPQRPAQTNTATTIDTAATENQGTTLMAPANAPIPRGAAVKPRRKKKRGKKKPAAKETTASIAPVSTHESAPAPTTTQAQPRTQGPGRNNKTLETAIEILKDVLIALQTGGDPTAVVLNGITTLIRNG